MDTGDRRQPRASAAGTPLFQYGMTLAAVAVGLRWLLDPVMGDTLPLVTLFGAVAVAVWVGGYRPALLAAAVGYFACASLFIEPRGRLGLGDARNAFGLVAYLITCSTIIGFGEAMRVARRREAEQKERLRTTLASIGDGVVTTDTAGRVTNLNAVAETLTGWTNADARGQPLDAVFRIVNETTRQPVENPAFRALKNGVIVGLANHTILIARDGSERPIDDSAAPIRCKEGVVVGCVLVFRDISDRKRAEDQLRRHAAELETVLATVPACVWIAHDPSCQRITGNRASDDLLRLPSDSNQSLSAPDDQRPAHFKVMRGGAELPTHELPVQRAAGGEDVRDFEEEVVFDNGTRRYLFGHATPLRGEDGRVRGAVAAFVDITQRKRNESLQAGQTAILEMVATGRPLPDVLGAVCRMIEGQEPGLLCSVLLPDGQRQRIGLAVGPSLPDAFQRRIEGLGIGPPYTGSCGEVLVCGEPVVVSDVRADGRFAPEWRELLTAHGLRACRSVPVVGSDGAVLASFALYRRAVGDPEPADKQLVQTATHLTGIAVERKRAEDGVRESERRLASILDQLPVGVSVMDFDGRMTLANPIMRRFVPEQIPSIDPARRPRWRARGPDGSPLEPEQWPGQRAIRGEHVAPGVEFLFTDDDGREVWTSVATAPLRGGGGEVAGAVVVIQDIDQRKRAEERLGATGERLRLIVESATDYAIFTVDGAGVIDGWNSGAARLFGYSDAEVIGQHDRLLYTPEDAAGGVPEREMSKAGAEGRAVNERWHVRKDGDRFWGSGLVQPLRAEGRVVGFLKIMRDMTEQRQLEAVREATQHTLVTLVERCPFGIYIVDADFRLASVNAGSQDKTFANVRPLIGRPFDEAVRIIWPEPLATDLIGIFRHTLATGEPYRSTDFVNPRADTGETEGYEWELHRIALPDGRNGVVCYYFDATKLRRAEEGLKVADRKKDEFLATLAHELRNPLAPIRNGIQIMKLAGGKPDAVERSRGMIERQVEQMARLIDDLMDLSRISQGKITLQKTRMRLAEAIRDAVDTSRPLVERQGHELALAVPDEPVFVDGDHTRLTQVFTNLLNNAAKYTDRGGRIRLAVERQGGEVVVSFEDNGVGIPADMLPKVFDMFAQVDRSLEKSQGGLGIGLNIVKKLVEMHDGTVGVVSAGHGRGSTFTVRLPVVLSLAPADATEEATEKVAPARRRILVVDDNTDGASSLAEMLDIMGNDTQTAHDGLEAVAVAEAFRPDVVLMDIGMPKLNGYEACRRIREQPWGRNVVIVAQTGWGQEDDKRKSQEAGFDFHMVKPVDPTLLEKLLAELKATTG